MKYGVVIRSTGEATAGIVLEAVRRDPLVGEVQIVADACPLYRAAAATHSAFSRWVGRFPYVMSIDADVIPFPGFGAWMSDVLRRHPHPQYGRWLPPLLDWVVQGRWRTAGGIFCYRTEETVGLHDKYLEAADLAEPEHNYSDVLGGFVDREWRPPLRQEGEIVSVHQFAQDWSAYFYRGIVHTLRIKDWIRPNVLALADSGYPEYRIFLEGVLWGMRNRGSLDAEDAKFRQTHDFSHAYQSALAKLQLVETDDRPKSYEDAVDSLTRALPQGMYPIRQQ
ncbi:MAG: hypothetical protein HN341_10015 [Verrucomicrobia bacterium]|jgi:hypothetical protein|nr:hypothetical protein [Verrucomicrobiota bacterium]